MQARPFMDILLIKLCGWMHKCDANISTLHPCHVLSSAFDIKSLHNLFNYLHFAKLISGFLITLIELGFNTTFIMFVQQHYLSGQGLWV